MPRNVTKLSRQLHETPADRPGPLDALKLARRTVIAGDRLDMKKLAADLGVDPATLFRWVGNRDQFMAEILWSTARPTWEQCLERAEVSGAERVVSTLTGFVEALVNAQWFRTYLVRESTRALKLLTTNATPAQERFIQVIEELLVAEGIGGDDSLPTPDLAYVLARIAQGYMYADLIVGEIPDPAKASAAFALVLGVGTSQGRAGTRKRSASS